MKYEFIELVRILGRDNEAALECLFDTNGWDYEEGVTMRQFLPEWTAMVEQGTLLKHNVPLNEWKK